MGGYFGGYYQILAGILKMQKKKSIFFFFGILLVFANTWDISVVIFFAIFLIRFSLMLYISVHSGLAPIISPQFNSNIANISPLPLSLPLLPPLQSAKFKKHFI